VLYQKDVEGSDRPIAFFSAKLRGAQLNYSVTEKECLAALKAMERFRPYVGLMPFTIVTDHASLQWLMTLKDLNGRLARWSFALQAFDFNIEHRKTKDNIVTDMLSRPNEAAEVKIFDFETTEFESPKYLEKLQLIEEHGRDKFPDLRVKEGLIFMKTHFNREESDEFEWKLWIPEALTTTLIQQAHSGDMAMHGGMAKTLARLQRMYYWPKMVVQVRDFVAACEKSKESKHTTQIKRPVMGKEVRTDRQIQKMYVNFLGKYPRPRRGDTMFFIALDHLTKFVWLKAMPRASSTAVIRFLQRRNIHPIRSSGNNPRGQRKIL